MAKRRNSYLMKVGFIGLGRMGGGMAHRLLKKGNELTVFDLVSEATVPFADAGAKVVGSIA